MNIPSLIGYFRYPTLAYQRTRGYFAAFPALLPVSAILEYSGTNPFVSATAVFDGQSIPVIATFGRLEAKFSTRLQDIGRQIDLQWTLRFAQDPTVINYTHRVLVTSADAVDPIPTLTGNPCNIPCDSQSIDATGYANPLYFATTSISTEYEGFSFDSNLLDGGAISNWCVLNAAGFIDVAPYTIPPYVGTPIWQERNRFCLQSVPRTNSDAIVVEIDTNFNSPTFGQTRTLTVADATLCPVGSTAPNWQNIGLPECQPEPRTDCRKQVLQRDENPLSPTYNTTQIVLLPANPNDCEDCPPSSLLPDYQDTGEWRCVQQSAVGRATSLAEKRQIDRNPFSATYNNDQWVTIGLRPDLCPIDTDPCNFELWTDVLDAECNIITRCKFDEPRSVSTRQKQQIQANDRLPNVGTIRWVDLPPSPDDELECPIAVCPVYYPVCPEQIRCKFDEPRFESTTERLEVDINPNSPTFGQQVWRDYDTDEILCPVEPEASQFSLSSSNLIINQLPQDSVPSCISIFYLAGANVDTDNNFSLFNITASPPEVREILRRWDATRTTFVTDARDMVSAPNTLPAWIETGITNGIRKFTNFVRFDDVIRWAKVYHSQRAVRLSNYPTTGVDSIRYDAWIGNDLTNVTTKLVLFDENDNILYELESPNETITVSNSAPYDLQYTSGCIADPSMNNAPHRNRQIIPNEAITDGTLTAFIYNNPMFRSVGLYKHQHEIYVNGVLYATQQGYINNLL